MGGVPELWCGSSLLSAGQKWRCSSPSDIALNLLSGADGLGICILAHSHVTLRPLCVLESPAQCKEHQGRDLSLPEVCLLWPLLAFISPPVKCGLESCLQCLLGEGGVL